MRRVDPPWLFIVIVLLYMYSNTMPRSARSEEERAFGVALGKRIALERETRSLSGDQLARSAGVSTDSVRSIEAGRISSPGIYLTARIARVLGVSLDDLTKSAMPAHTETEGQS